jgi:hypothetical protein
VYPPRLSAHSGRVEISAQAQESNWSYGCPFVSLASQPIDEVLRRGGCDDGYPEWVREPFDDVGQSLDRLIGYAFDSIVLRKSY